MRGTTLLELLTMVRSELGRSENPGTGASDVPEIKRKINRVYEGLYLKYDWPFLNTHFDKIPLAAGQRYYDFPDALDYDRVEAVFIWWNLKCDPIKRGITPDDYNTFDSTNDERSSLVMKWDVRHTGTREQCEVWPMPSDNTSQELQFVGLRKFARLVNNADRCRLDDNLVALFAAAAVTKDKDEAAKLMAQGQDLLTDLRAAARSGEPDFRLNLGAEEPNPFKNVTIRVS